MDKSMLLKKITLSMFALVMAARCAPSPRVTPSGSAQATLPQPAPSVTVRPTQVPTSQVSQTPDVVATITPTANNADGLTRACIDPGKSTGISLSPGRIVMVAIDNPSQVAMMNTETGSMEALPGSSEKDVISSVHVSPDFTRIAYRNETLGQLMVGGAIGSVSLNISWPATWQQIDGWLNEHQLIVDVSTTGEGHGLVLLDVDSQAQTELPATFPDLIAFDPDPFWQWFNATKIIYNRTARTALYPGKSSGIGALILRSLSDDRIITELPGTISYGLTPIWSPDNQHTVIKGPASLLSAEPKEDVDSTQEELYLLDADGVTKQITHLTESWEEVDFYQYSWSPDGTRLAFRFIAGPYGYPDLYPTSRPDLPGRLAVLDLESGMIMDYCLPSGQSLAAPVWSPDGRYLLAEDYYHSLAPYENKVYAVDLEKHVASVLIDGFTPIGWVALK
jgi:hypothetical protein